jgi:hypothetical protein
VDGGLKAAAGLAGFELGIRKFEPKFGGIEDALPGFGPGR